MVTQCSEDTADAYFFGEVWRDCLVMIDLGSEMPMAAACGAWLS